MTQTANAPKVPWVLAFQRKDLLTAGWGGEKEANLLHHLIKRASWEAQNSGQQSFKNITFQDEHDKILKDAPMAEGTLITYLKRFNLAGYITLARYGSMLTVHLEAIQAAFTSPPTKPLSAPRGRPKGSKVSRIKKAKNIETCENNTETSRINDTDNTETLEKGEVSNISNHDEVLSLKLEVLRLKERVLILEDYVLKLKLSESAESAPQANAEEKNAPYKSLGKDSDNPLGKGVYSESDNEQESADAPHTPTQFAFQVQGWDRFFYHDFCIHEQDRGINDGLTLIVKNLVDVPQDAECSICYKPVHGPHGYEELLANYRANTLEATTYRPEKPSQTPILIVTPTPTEDTYGSAFISDGLRAQHHLDRLPGSHAGDAAPHDPVDAEADQQSADGAAGQQVPAGAVHHTLASTGTHAGEHTTTGEVDALALAGVGPDRQYDPAVDHRLDRHVGLAAVDGLAGVAQEGTPAQGKEAGGMDGDLSRGSTAALSGGNRRHVGTGGDGIAEQVAVGSQAHVPEGASDARGYTQSTTVTARGSAGSRTQTLARTQRGTQGKQNEKPQLTLMGQQVHSDYEIIRASRLRLTPNNVKALNELGDMDGMSFENLKETIELIENQNLVKSKSIPIGPQELASEKGYWSFDKWYPVVVRNRQKQASKAATSAPPPPSSISPATTTNYSLAALVADNPLAVAGGMQL